MALFYPLNSDCNTRYRGNRHRPRRRLGSHRGRPAGGFLLGAHVQTGFELGVAQRRSGIAGLDVVRFRFPVCHLFRPGVAIAQLARGAAGTRRDTKRRRPIPTDRRHGPDYARRQFGAGGQRRIGGVIRLSETASGSGRRLGRHGLSVGVINSSDRGVRRSGPRSRHRRGATCRQRIGGNHRRD